VAAVAVLWSLALVTPAGAARISQYTLPNADSNPTAITAGPDGALWFAEDGKIGRITTRGRITEFPLPDTEMPVVAMTAGPDGAVWFLRPSYVFYIPGKIGRITTAGKITEFPGPADGNSITAGPDGALWWSGFQINELGKITTAGVLTEFPGSFGGVEDIAVGSDGALWFTQHNTGSIGRITTAGMLKGGFTLPGFPGPSPRAITAGPDGALWFAISGPRVGIGRLTTAGAFTEFPLSRGAGEITAGPDRAVWFTGGGGTISRITTRGALSHFDVPGGAAGLARGPDGALWFTQPSDNAIGRLLPQPGDARRACRAERAKLGRLAFRAKYGVPFAMLRCIAAQKG
jgi:virginiamycin B lyase